MSRVGKLLITGCRGQLGQDLERILSVSYQVMGVDIEEVDISKKDAVANLVVSTKPDLVVHAAAYTDVDGCESNPELAMVVNGEGTRNVALACAEIGARMLYYSTDYVFDGEKSEAYAENDPPDPKTAYGKSKLAGEEAVREVLSDDGAILRISWVYGRHGNNFLKTMLRLARHQIVQSENSTQRKPLRVVDDQVGNPTWTEEIARQTETVIKNELSGLYHATSEEEVSWYKFACDIFDLAKLDVSVLPCTTDEFPRPAPRPKRSSLANTRLQDAGLNRMRDYHEALTEFLDKNLGELIDEV